MAKIKFGKTDANNGCSSNHFKTKTDSTDFLKNFAPAKDREICINIYSIAQKLDHMACDAIQGLKRTLTTILMGL